jgi:hypothetical protein
MSRDQTLYSELLVGSAIGDCLVADIAKVRPSDIEAFERESKKRGNLRSDKSGLELSAAGQKVRAWILKQQIGKVGSIEWTGDEKVQSLETIAQDLTIPNLGLSISVKEDAQLFQNPSPVKVFEKWPSGDFSPSRDDDWFLRVAENELDSYFVACGGPSETGEQSVRDYYEKFKGKDDSGKNRRKIFTEHVKNLHSDRSTNALDAYQLFCRKVSEESANTFNRSIQVQKARSKTSSGMASHLEKLFSYFFKIGERKYILCGTEGGKAFALQVEDLETWKGKYRLWRVYAEPINAGQPEVLLNFEFEDLSSGSKFKYGIKCEVRWSHGKFCGNPESKLYKHKNWKYADLPWVTNL